MKCTAGSQESEHRLFVRGLVSISMYLEFCCIILFASFAVSKKLGSKCIAQKLHTLTLRSDLMLLDQVVEDYEDCVHFNQATIKEVAHGLRYLRVRGILIFIIVL